MRRYEGKIVAILITVIIHLIAGIIFMSFKIHSLNTKKDKEEKFEIEFAAIKESIEQEQVQKTESEKKVELRPASVENVFHNDAEMLNIARNMANKSETKINPKDYINQVKEELIKSGQLGVDNYIDAQKGGGQLTGGDEAISMGKNQEDQIGGKQEKEKPKESLKMAANYQGPTRIYYDLAGRNHIYLSIPIYKCQGSGKIVLSIEVDAKGSVMNASIIAGESTTHDECLIETAVEAALKSRFNSNINAPKSQKGTLTYIFVAQ